MEDSYKRLSDRIWETRKCRIHTEMRLKNKKSISDILICYYSIILVCLSIRNLLYPDEIVYQLSLIFGSIIVLCGSIYLNGRKYTERSIQMRNCYLQLYKLMNRAKRIESQNDNDQEQILKIDLKYTTILSNIENHSPYDYLCARIETIGEETTFRKLKWYNWVIYFFSKFWRFLFIILLFLLPLIIILANKISTD